MIKHKITNRKKLVRFNAVKTVKKSVNVNFRTKDGKSISFKATKAVEQKKPVKFYAKKKK